MKGDNNRFRSVWWRTVVAETLAENPAFGLGFGHDLARNFLREFNPEMADDFTARDEPLALFQEWYEAAKLSEPSDPNAMSLSTVDTSGMPNVRMVLLKDLDRRGFTFYTNLESAKGIELLATPKAAACFHWKSLRRQIRVRGPVEIGRASCRERV